MARAKFGSRAIASFTSALPGRMIPAGSAIRDPLLELAF